MTLTLKLLALTKAKLKMKVKTKVMDGWLGGEKGGLGQGWERRKGGRGETFDLE